VVKTPFEFPIRPRLCTIFLNRSMIKFFVLDGLLR
jgi:hypothetical protein